MIFNKKNKSILEIAEDFLINYGDKIDFELILSDKDEKLTIYTKDFKKSLRTAKTKGEKE